MSSGDAGRLYVEIRHQETEEPIAVMSPDDFRRSFGGRAAEGTVAIVSAVGLDGRRVDLGPIAWLRDQVAIRAVDASEFAASKVARP